MSKQQASPCPSVALHRPLDQTFIFQDNPLSMALPLDYTLRFTSPTLSDDSGLSDTTTLVDEDVQAYDYTKKDS